LAGATGEGREARLVIADLCCPSARIPCKSVHLPGDI